MTSPGSSWVQKGTLGIITEVQLRLYGIPEAISAAVCSFDTMEGAIDTVMLTIQTGHPRGADRTPR